MNIYEALHNDHEEVKQLMDDLIALKIDDDYRFVLINEIRDALIPHSRAEESVFYNTLRAINAGVGEVWHGYKEHMEAEALLRSLQVMDKMNLDWKSTAEKLREALLHHIDEEETEIFAVARQALTEDEAVAIADAFEAMKPQIKGEGLMKTTAEAVINLMPPRLADSIRHWSDSARS